MNQSVVDLEQALPIMRVLVFDLGQSRESIQEMFHMGYMLVWNSKFNFYSWVYSSWDCNMLAYL